MSLGLGVKLGMTNGAGVARGAVVGHGAMAGHYAGHWAWTGDMNDDWVLMVKGRLLSQLIYIVIMVFFL